MAVAGNGRLNSSSSHHYAVPTPYAIELTSSTDHTVEIDTAAFADGLIFYL